MTPDHYDLVPALRRSIDQLRTLGETGHLTPERFAFLTDQLEASAAAIALALEDADQPQELFHVTRAGIHAMREGPVDTAPRAYGSLRCLDGGLA
ncbi:hypothetical protein [Reyranella sp.]|uniref:hypothetical protein n=1 Tax=Reyranella sp. TaxID=1929291 RepID=UPI002731904C|nr:hypothetical protein [Reyranella sp.]MDP2376560.1 hypothetical protein [Reyranella sp.]